MFTHDHAAVPHSFVPHLYNTSNAKLHGHALYYYIMSGYLCNLVYCVIMALP